MKNKIVLVLFIIFLITTIILSGVCVKYYLDNKNNKVEISTLVKDKDKLEADVTSLEGIINDLRDELKNSINIDNNTANNTIVEDEVIEGNKIVLASYCISKSWNIQHYGAAIFSDGSIYKWKYYSELNEDKKYDSLHLDKLSGLTKYVLENGTKLDESFSKENMNIINNYIENIDNKLEESQNQGMMFDGPRSYVDAWNSKNNRIQLYFDDGSKTKENKTEKGQELIKLIEKYNK